MPGNFLIQASIYLELQKQAKSRSLNYELKSKISPLVLTEFIFLINASCPGIRLSSGTSGKRLCVCSLREPRGQGTNEWAQAANTACDVSAGLFGSAGDLHFFIWLSGPNQMRCDQNWLSLCRKTVLLWISCSRGQSDLQQAFGAGRRTFPTSPWHMGNFCSGYIIMSYTRILEYMDVKAG